MRTQRISFQPMVCFLVGALLSLLVPSVSWTQSPIATISSFSGSVRVSVNGKESIAAANGMTLQTGDVIQTDADGQVVLTLSEGSELRIGQNTKIALSQLAQRPNTQGRTSRLKLWYGKLQATLSPGHQKKGSSFTIDTPNATAGVKFSHPEIEVNYDPETRSSLILAYTVSMTVQNLLTRERATMTAGHQAIVQDVFLWITPIGSGMQTIPREEQQRQTQAATLLQTRQITGGTVSPAPVSSGSRAETSQSPGPSGSPGVSRPRQISVGSEEE